MSAKYTEADWERVYAAINFDHADRVTHVAQLIADVRAEERAEERERCAGSPSELLRALAFLAACDGVGYRVEEIFARARSKGWEP